MNYAEAIRFSIEALKANRLRTFLTALGLIIGNASVILVVTISLASKDLILDQIRGIGSNLIYASYETAGQDSASVQADFVKLADVQALRRELGDQIVAAAPVFPRTESIVIKGKVREVSIIGVDQNYKPVRNLVILKGRPFDTIDISLRERVVVVTPKLAKLMFGSESAALGQTVKVSQLKFKVIGIFREKTSTFNTSEVRDEAMLMPYTVLRYFVPYERVDPVYVQVKNADDVERVTKEMRTIIERRHRKGAKYEVANLQSILETANQVASILTVVLVIVSAIALAISGIGIMNIMLVTVTERTREIGLRMAVGASRREILSQFLTESVVISLIGGAIGIACGIVLPLSVQLFTDRISISVSPISILVAFGVSFAVGVGFGLLPAQRASRLNPTDALRYE